MGEEAMRAYVERKARRDKDIAASDALEIMVNSWLNYHEPLTLNGVEVRAILHAIERLRS